jgi:cytochrome P450
MKQELDVRMEQVNLQPILPDGFNSSLRQFWLLISQPRTFTAALRERYGEVVMIDHKGEKNVVALTPDGARQILLADPDGYDAFWKEGFTGVAGPGSIWVLGEKKHHRERQLLTPAFHGKGFGAYGKVIRDITSQKTGKWRTGQTVRVIDTTLAISLDVIMQLVFGVQDGPLMEDGHEILSALLKTYHPLIVFFPNLQRNWFPLWVRHTRAKVNFSTWLARQLGERRALNQDRDDILGRMMTAHYEDGSQMRDEDIRDELVTILMAGHETTATALAWVLYELGRHPAELERLRAEIIELGEAPDPAQVVKLPYLSAVCNETLRLHTLLPEVARVLITPLKLCQYAIPAGTFVTVSVMAIHHDPDIYPEPDKFIPARFLERTYTPFEFLPFGGGHRRCLGAALSDFEMRIALAEIVMNWDVESASAEKEIRHDIAMGPKHGVRLRVTAR